jgi:hypothetical protein
MAGKTKKGEVETRKNTQSRPAQHEALCSVCNHSERNEIEQQFMAFEQGSKLASDFGLSESAICRHAQYFGLHRKRITNTEKVLEIIVERGMIKGSDVPVNMIVESIKELHKVRGKHKEPAKNPEDAARSAMADFLSKNPHVKREDIAPIYAEQYGVSVEQISEAIY